MFNISFEINGREIGPNEFASALEQAMVEKVQGHIESKLHGIRPTITGERLNVKFRGSRLDDLSVVLSGPEELVAEAKKRLG